MQPPRARIISRLISFSPSHEIILAVPASRYSLTPPRLSDVADKLRLLNDPSVSPSLYSPPNHSTTSDGTARTTAALKDTSAIVERWVGTGTPDGCPFQAIREVDELGEQSFVGELGVFREASFLEVREGEDRDQAVSDNLGRKSGDPKIVWTMFCESGDRV